MDRRYRKITTVPKTSEAVRDLMIKKLSAGYREVRCARDNCASLWSAYALLKKEVPEIGDYSFYSAAGKSNLAQVLRSALTPRVREVRVVKVFSEPVENPLAVFVDSASFRRECDINANGS